MEPSDLAGPRKRQIEGWRQVARRTAEVKRRTRKGPPSPEPALQKEK